MEDSTINDTVDVGEGNNAGDFIHIYWSKIINNNARDGGGISNILKGYIDDISIITGNTPNIFESRQFIHA